MDSLLSSYVHYGIAAEKTGHYVLARSIPRAALPFGTHARLHVGAISHCSVGSTRFAQRVNLKVRATIAVYERRGECQRDR